MLPALLNLQSNRFLSGEECLLLGEITPVANTANDCQQLRQEVESLDQQVIEALTPVLPPGLSPSSSAVATTTPSAYSAPPGRHYPSR